VDGLDFNGLARSCAIELNEESVAALYVSRNTRDKSSTPGRLGTLAVGMVKP
jgi:hypothetical protein